MLHAATEVQLCVCNPIAAIGSTEWTVVSYSSLASMPLGTFASLYIE